MDIIFFLLSLTIMLLTSVSGQSCTPQVIKPSEDPIQMFNITFTCYLFNCMPFKQDYKVIWRRNTGSGNEDVFIYDDSTKINTGLSDLASRSNGSMSTESHRLFINTRLADIGAWLCTFKVLDDESPSSSEDLDVFVIPTEKDVSLLPLNTLIAGTSTTFSCTIDHARPRFDAAWKWGSENVTQVTTNHTKNTDGHTFRLNSTALVELETVGSHTIKCTFTDSDERKYDVQKNRTVIVYASAFIENMTGPDNDITISDGLKITCLVTGTDVTTGWYLDNIMVQDSLYNVINTPMYGTYRHGQDRALESIITWNAKSHTCRELENITGNYDCRAKASIGAGISSTPIAVNLIYKPSNYTVESTVEEKVELGNKVYRIDCSTHICANPTVQIYSWTVESGDKPDGITGWDSSTLVINAVAEHHTNRKYICNATNSVGHGHVTVLLSIDTSQDGPNVGAIVGGCLGGAALCGLIAGVVILYKKKKKQQADQEVVAYAESNTPNATNGVNAEKKGTSRGKPTVASPVYSEVNKNNKQLKKEESTGPVYSQVNKSGRPLPQLQPKPSTNTGPVYSEVKKTKQGRLTPIEKQHYDNAGKSNDHGGIHYADVDFLRQSNGNKQSHGTKNPAYEPTEYAQIDHRKSAGIVV